MDIENLNGITAIEDAATETLDTSAQPQTEQQGEFSMPSAFQTLKGKLNGLSDVPAKSNPINPPQPNTPDAVNNEENEEEDEEDEDEDSEYGTSPVDKIPVMQDPDAPNANPSEPAANGSVGKKVRKNGAKVIVRTVDAAQKGGFGFLYTVRAEPAFKRATAFKNALKVKILQGTATPLERKQFLYCDDFIETYRITEKQVKASLPFSDEDKEILQEAIELQMEVSGKDLSPFVIPGLSKSILTAWMGAAALPRFRPA